MASRPVVVQVHQQNRDAVAAGVKQKNVAAEGRNRRALGDIGNFVTARGVEGGKPLPQVSRPITRSFCAQLLANAQAAAVAENNKKCKPVNVDGAVGADGIPKATRRPAQKKATVKPKPEAVIEISSGSEEQINKDKPRKKSEGDGLSKKNAPTLTSTLTARSKAACGLSKKPKQQIVDIDAGDVDNELAVVEYVEDIYKFYKHAENESRVPEYIESQPELNMSMRSILIDWLIEVHHKFELNPETLYLTINIVDRYLAVRTTVRKELQLVGMSAMLIASKYEEIWAPEVNDFVCIADRAFGHEQVLVMEKRILGGLEWNLTVPTPYVFLVRFIKASIPDTDMENMVYFFAELGMMNYGIVVNHSPSMIAASAVYAARCTMNKKPVWDDTLKLHTGFSEYQLMDCAKILASLHSTAADNKLKVVFRKYSSSERGAVALKPPAKSLLASSPSS